MSVEMTGRGEMLLRAHLAQLAKDLMTLSEKEWEKSRDKTWAAWFRDRAYGTSHGLAEAANRIEKLIAAAAKPSGEVES